MLRTTIYLDENMAQAIRRLADARQRSQAEIIREALRQYLKSPDQSTARPLPSGLGAYRSGRNDVSQQAEELLGKAIRQRHR